MSIQSNKLVNLADAQVLYNDLRDRDSSLKSALNSIKEPNLYDDDDITESARINPDGDIITSQLGFFLSDYMPVTPGQTYYKNSPTEDSYHRIVYYLSTKVKIAGTVSANNTTVAPANSAYARICGLNAEINTTEFYMVSAKDTVARKANETTATNITAEIENRQSEISFVEQSIENITGDVSYRYDQNTRRAYNNLGVATTQANEESVIVECSPGDVFYVKGYGQANGRLWAFADASYNNLGDSGSGKQTQDFIKIVAPASAKYVICNSYYPQYHGQLVKGEPVNNQIDRVEESSARQFDEISGNRKFYQYINSTSKIANEFWSAFDSQTGRVSRTASNNTACYAPIHLSAGTYKTTKIYAAVSFIVFDDTTGGKFTDVYSDQGSGTNRAYTFTLTQGATVYISLAVSDGYTTAMIIDGDTLPSSFVDEGNYITGLSDDLSIGDYTVKDVNDFISDSTGNSNADYMYIKDGKVTSNGNKAQYAEVDVKSKITLLKAKIIFLPGADTDTATLIAVKSIRENSGGPVADIGNGSVHINFQKGSVGIEYFEGGSNHHLQDSAYSTACTADGETEYEIGFEFRGSNVLRVYKPDGQTIDVTNEHFDSNNGNYLIFETSSVTGDSTKILYTALLCKTEDAIPYLR